MTKLESIKYDLEDFNNLFLNKKLLKQKYVWCTGERVFDKEVWHRGYLHFKTITRHRHLVMQSCFKVGLYYQGLMHDMSKYHPVEFIPSMLFYQYGHRSPNNEERERLGVTKSWHHHKGRNKHHYEYWMDYTVPPVIEYKGSRMDDRYIVEMFLDRVAACKVYQGANYTNSSAWDYYIKGPVSKLLHPYSRKVLEHLLLMMKNNGEKSTFSYIKDRVKHNFEWKYELTDNQ